MTITAQTERDAYDEWARGGERCNMHAAELPSATLEDRRELCAARVTLDGQPAVIGGARNRFATVAMLGGSGHAVEYAWSTVGRIVASGGTFWT